MKLKSIFLVIIGVLGLISIRVLEDKIFYDPFISYFRNNDVSYEIPSFSSVKIILHYIFRFFLNLIFSLIVIQGFFNNKKWTKEGALLIILFFVITFPIYLFCLFTEFSLGELFSFYMRRFVIQPLILLLIIPIFYYRKEINN